MTVAAEQDKLRLGKGMAFVKSQLRRLRQEDDTWEADFRALPKSITQTAMPYIGMVLTQPDGFLLAESQIEQSPTVNDLATLLAYAMKRPLTEGTHRPRNIHLRGNPKWKPLLPALKELGIEVIVQRQLPKVDEAYDELLSQMKEAHSVGKIAPTAEQAKVEQSFPAIAKWVRDYGHIEIGDQEGFGFLVRVLDYGGVVFEDERPTTLADAMAALEERLKRWFEEQGSE